jgi:hypothetical protein
MIKILKYRNPNNGMAPLVHEDDMRRSRSLRRSRSILAGSFSPYCGAEAGLVACIGLLTGAKIIYLSARTITETARPQFLSESPPHPHPPQHLSITKTSRPACKAADRLCNGCSSPPDVPPQPQPPPQNCASICAEPIPRPEHFLRQPRRGLALQCSCVDVVGSPWLLSAAASHEPAAA